MLLCYLFVQAKKHQRDRRHPLRVLYFAFERMDGRTIVSNFLQRKFRTSEPFFKNNGFSQRPSLCFDFQETKQKGKELE